MAARSLSGYPPVDTPTGGYLWKDGKKETVEKIILTPTTKIVHFVATIKQSVIGSVYLN